MILTSTKEFCTWAVVPGRTEDDSDLDLPSESDDESGPAVAAGVVSEPDVAPIGTPEDDDEAPLPLARTGPTTMGRDHLVAPPRNE